MGAAADGVSCNATSRTEVAMFGKTACGARQPSSERRNVLVVDDMYLNRIVLGKLLASFGFVVTYSSDGQEAVDTFLKRKESNEDFFMILMVRI